MTPNHGNSQEGQFFKDATLEELITIYNLLPKLDTYKLNVLEKWADGIWSWSRGEYATGHQWLIRYLKDEL